MRVDDTWILVNSFDDLYINLGWFIKWRPFGMSIGDTLKIEESLSNGNMVKHLHGGNILNATGGKLTLTFKDGSTHVFEVEHLRELMEFLKSEFVIKYDVFSTGKPKPNRYEFETDMDEEIARRNRRLALLGGTDRVFTDGIDIIKEFNGTDLVDRSKISRHTVYKGKLQMDNYVTVDVADMSFINLGELRYKGILVQSSAEQSHLRFICSDAWYDNMPELVVDDNVLIESYKGIKLSPNNIRRVKRLYNCGLEYPGEYDLSNVDYIGPDGVGFTHNYDKKGEYILNFGNKMIALIMNSITTGPYQNIIIKYSNPGMNNLLRDLTEYRSNIKVIYEGA